MSPETQPHEHFYLDKSGLPNRFFDPIVKERMEALNAQSTRTLEQVHKFLFYGNGGGAAAMLAFLGTRDIAIPGHKFALICFCVGLVLFGIYLSWLYKLFRRIQMGWADDSQIFYANKISWEALFKNDRDRASDLKLGYWLAYGSFGAFILGMVCGMVRMLWQ